MALNQFIKEYSLPFGIVINNSKTVQMLSEKIVQIPASLI